MAMNTKQVATDITFRIRRFDPEVDKQPSYQAYKVNVQPGWTVLDGLIYIRDHLDPTLSWRYSCRMGVCGSCAMMINGKPMLACNNQVLNLTNTEIVLAPLVNFDIIKDLAPDLQPLFSKHKSILPYMHREDPNEKENPKGEFGQDEDELMDYLQFTYCIRCGACMAACPTLAAEVGYLGPMPLAQAYKWTADSRDEGFDERKNTLGGENGVSFCHYAGECSNVCPKGVDPARAIQLLKKQLVKDYFGWMKTGKTGCGSKELPADAGRPRREGIPEAPAFTIPQK
jgi:succinate dehydrogenase / fumarate reductase iron-sulfur subunit